MRQQHRPHRGVAVVAAAWLVGGCDGHAHYQAQLPNGRNVRGHDGIGAWHAVGHVAPRPQEYPTYVLGGFPRNQFGLDFAAAGHRWTVDLCQKDSDGDGRTNGEELGDPDCVWRPGLGGAAAVGGGGDGGVGGGAGAATAAAAAAATTTTTTTLRAITHPGMSPESLAAFAFAAANLSSPSPASTVGGRGWVAWKSAALSTDTFTDVLFYYQFVAIPLILAVAIGASYGARRVRAWRRSPTASGWRVAPYPSPIGVFFAYYVLFIIGVGCGVHRYFSHKTYTATPPWKAFLALLSLFVGQGGPLDWAFVHRLHHRLCEQDLDYHSPFNVRHTASMMITC
jgi:hypothetical protein